jgi:hypothetical protein
MKRMPGILAASLAVLTLAACEDVTRPPTANSPSSDSGVRLPNAIVEGDPEYTDCEGTVSGPHKNVVVREGGFCFLVGATVEGYVVALKDAVLAVFDTQIGETLFGFEADVINTGRITVGDIALYGGTQHPVFTEVAICGARVEGNVIVEQFTGTIIVNAGLCGSPNVFTKEVRLRNNRIPAGEEFLVSANTVTFGPMRVLGNRGVGPKTVQGNTVGGTLTCENNEAPFVGGPNVALRKRGQCF